MFYRFPINDFVEADTFEEAKAKLLKQVEQIERKQVRKVKCTCLGLSHRYNCPEYVQPY